jgi:phospholipid/cholesterol/gamma-HCH transport system substrate-binding protein
MKKYRTLLNVITFLVASAGLIVFGARNLLVQTTAGPKLHAEFTDASGISPRNDVTMRGVVIGSVVDVDLTDTGVMVDMQLERGAEVPEGSKALIVRRSPIGELTIELEPGTGPPLENGARIAVDDTLPPPDVSTTIEALADILHAVPSSDLHTVVAELATAVDGRARDLQRFTDASAALPKRLLEIESELESLITTGPELTGVFADNADVLADDLRQTAVLADILRDRRFDLLDLYRNGSSFTRVATDLIVREKANIACFLRDSGDLNAVMASDKALEDLVATLDKNHFFFDAADQAVQKDQRGWTWFRVQLLPHTEPQARSYTPPVGAPDVYPGRACGSIYGPGVGPADQQGFTLAPGSKIKR